MQHGADLTRRSSPVRSDESDVERFLDERSRSTSSEGQHPRGVRGTVERRPARQPREPPPRHVHTHRTPQRPRPPALERTHRLTHPSTTLRRAPRLPGGPKVPVRRTQRTSRCHRAANGPPSEGDNMLTRPLPNLATPETRARLFDLQADVFALWREGLMRADDEQVRRSAEAGKALRAATALLCGDHRL
jgi:hypothetical protein